MDKYKKECEIANKLSKELYQQVMVYIVTLVKQNYISNDLLIILNHQLKIYAINFLQNEMGTHWHELKPFYIFEYDFKNNYNLELNFNYINNDVLDEITFKISDKFWNYIHDVIIKYDLSFIDKYSHKHLIYKTDTEKIEYDINFIIKDYINHIYCSQHKHTFYTLLHLDYNNQNKNTYFSIIPKDIINIIYDYL